MNVIKKNFNIYYIVLLFSMLFLIGISCYFLNQGGFNNHLNSGVVGDDNPLKPLTDKIKTIANWVWVAVDIIVPIAFGLRIAVLGFRKMHADSPEEKEMIHKQIIHTIIGATIVVGAVWLSHLLMNVFKVLQFN